MKFSSSVSTKTSRTFSNTEQREFSMEIYVRAEQEQMPAGMAKVLGILEEAITVQKAVNRTATK